MRRVLGSTALLWLVVAVAAFTPLAAWSADAAEPAVPSDAEVTKFIAVWKALAADPSSASEVCATFEDDAEDDSGEDFDATEIGRELEANPTLGPVLQRQAISGRRFVETSVHLFAGMLGLAMADALDAGQGAANREAVLRDSPSARVVASHQTELDPVMQRAQELCSPEDSEPEDDSEFEEDSE